MLHLFPLSTDPSSNIPPLLPCCSSSPSVNKNTCNAALHSSPWQPGWYKGRKKKRKKKKKPGAWEWDWWTLREKNQGNHRGVEREWQRGGNWWVWGARVVEMKGRWETRSWRFTLTPFHLLHPVRRSQIVSESKPPNTWIISYLSARSILSEAWNTSEARPLVLPLCFHSFVISSSFSSPPPNLFHKTGRELHVFDLVDFISAVVQLQSPAGWNTYSPFRQNTLFYMSTVLRRAPTGLTGILGILLLWPRNMHSVYSRWENPAKKALAVVKREERDVSDAVKAVMSPRMCYTTSSYSQSSNRASSGKSNACVLMMLFTEL